MIGCVIVTICMAYELFTSDKGFKKFEKNTHFMATLMLAGALILSLGGLAGLHGYLIVTNMSTLEMGDLDKVNPFGRTKKVRKLSNERRGK